MSLAHKSLFELSELFQKGTVKSREITEACIKEIESHEKNIHAFVTQTFDLAREMADASDARKKNKSLKSPLDGLPFTLKDVVCTHGIRTTASSNILKDFIPPYDATVWKKLKNAGVVLLGKMNTDEFTMGVSTETSAFGVTKNPHDLTRVPGGSSGGSAAAIAAHFCAGSIGTDTGGSIRQPAHFCGITGLKVSYGRVSRYGVIPMASSLDTIGPLAKTPQDCAMILQVIAGQDPKDSTTSPHPVPNYMDEISESIENLTIGIPKEYFSSGIDADTMKLFESAKAIFLDLGIKIKEVSLPHTKYAIPAYYIIAPAEISANMARYDGIRFGSGIHSNTLDDIYFQTREEGLGDETKRRIMTGIHVLSAGYTDQFYLQAQKVRTIIKEEFEQVFQDVDVLFAPVSPSPAFKIGEKIQDPVKMYMEDVLTTPVNLAGICSISVPIGKSEKENLPIGAQIIGPAFTEERILRVAHAFYQEFL